MGYDTLGADEELKILITIKDGKFNLSRSRNMTDIACAMVLLSAYEKFYELLDLGNYVVEKEPESQLDPLDIKIPEGTVIQ